MRVLASCLIVVGLAAAAAADEIQVPGDYATIQAAVEAAAEGDVVIVGPGIHAESVVAAKSNLTIEGRGAIWDGGSGPCLQLTGDGNTVAGFRFTGGVDQVTLIGADATVTRCRSEDAGDSFLVIQGSGAVVIGCRAEDSGGDAVVVEGDGASLVRVRVAGCGGTGIEVTGNSDTLLGCRVQGAADGGVAVEGDDCTLTRVKVMGSASFGFDLAIDSSVVQNCIAINSGSEGGAGYEISGTTNEIRACLAVHCTSDGFSVEGDGNAMTRDNAVNCEDDGFDIQGGVGVSLTGCTAANNGEEGVENGGTDTDAERCRLVSNETDLALDGGLAASFGDVLLTNFQTGSTTTVVIGD